MRIPVPWVFLLAYFIALVPQAYLPVALPPGLRHVVRIAGFVLLPAGVVLAVWCLAIFRRQRTTTIPGQPSRTLVTWGPYRFTRNPMYVALTLVYLGEAALLGQVWPLVTLIAVLGYVHWTVVPIEEARLAETFGAAYGDYRGRVRRWF